MCILETWICRDCGKESYNPDYELCSDLNAAVAGFHPLQQSHRVTVVDLGPPFGFCGACFAPGRPQPVVFDEQAHAQALSLSNMASHPGFNAMMLVDGGRYVSGEEGGERFVVGGEDGGRFVTGGEARGNARRAYMASEGVDNARRAHMASGEVRESFSICWSPYFSC